jgi:M6 family metalloprotease-like protein
MTPTLATLGHGSIRQNGRLATGGRPLLIILGEYSNFPAFSTFHSLQYYEQLGFGSPTPPFSTENPVNPASVREYFRENSYGRFWFDRVAVVGPVDLGVYANDPGPEARTAGILSKVALTAPQLFAAADADLDRLVEVDELCVVLFENIVGLQPANRDNNPVGIRLQLGPITWDGTVRVHIAGSGALTPFYQTAHELSHSIGTVDMYNTGAGNFLLTLMGAYSFDSNNQATVHLDLWHKMVLGWAEPRIFRMRSPNATPVRDTADGAIVLWEEPRGASEYFIIERRQPRSYDANVPDNGVLIWRVQQGVVNGVAHMGAPDLTPGGSGVWTSGTQTPILRWANGESTGITLTINAESDGSMRVAWGEAVIQPGRSRHLRLLHGGCGTTPVDSGLPLTGVFYGVTAEANLEWNRYNGMGQQISDPAALQAWGPNTGNLIGRGWGSMLHILGCGDGVILAVNPNGNLHWYQYDGDGESDVTGGTGWHRNSGNVIGNGWQGFRRMFVKARAGRSTSQMALFCVAQNGDLLWYSYHGEGEQDPSGGTGWHPNSGNPIGRGWHNFRHIHGSSNVFFAVSQNGDLLWYSYGGQGEADVSGGTGWHSNSGNPIGNGWQGMQHIFGGISDVGGFAHIIMAVDANGDLRWYRYTGQGERDVTGNLGWDQRSGRIIGTRW